MGPLIGDEEGRVSGRARLVGSVGGENRPVKGLGVEKSEGG
jgi:hypothetical protein